MAKATNPPGPGINAGGKSRRASASQQAPDRVRGGEARRIADYVPAIGDTSFRKFGFVQSSIVMRWPEIVGLKLAQVTSPESLRFPQGKKSQGVLHVTVTGAHAPVVQHILPDIIARVNQFFGYAAVVRVQINQGRVAAKLAQPAKPVSSQTPPFMTAPISPDLKGIVDLELRAVLEGLAGSMAKLGTLPKVS